MKKSTLILLLLFIVTGLGTLIYLNNQGEEKQSTLADFEADFSIPNTDDIGKIFLVSRQQGTKTLLERKGNSDEWTVNNEYATNPRVIESLLMPIRNMRIKYHPSKEAIPNILKTLAIDQVKTEIYDKKGNLMKTYYVGGVTNDARGTYVLMEGSEKPYVMEIPNLSGNFKSRFDLPLRDWRDRAVFRENPDDIVFASVEYPKQKSLSFIYELVDGEKTIRPFYDVTPKINKPLAQGAVDHFLIGFEKCIAEIIVANNSTEEKYLKEIPFTKINLKFKDGKEKEVVFYQRRETNPMSNGRVADKIEKFATTINNETEMIYITQVQVFKDIFVGYPGFFK